MPRSKPPLVPLHELTVGQEADFFALLAEKVRGARRDGKPFYTCRFRDARRTVAFMAWSDGPYFAACEQDWQEGDFYKIRGCYEEHKVYGPQIAIEMIRPVTPADLADGFDPGRFIECSRYDRDAMFAELIGLAEAHIGDGPLRKLVLSLLERHRDALRRIPATLKHFHPFCGGWLEHTLSVTHSCLQVFDFPCTYPLQFSKGSHHANRVFLHQIQHETPGTWGFGTPPDFPHPRLVRAASCPA